MKNSKHIFYLHSNYSLEAESNQAWNPPCFGKGIYTGVSLTHWGSDFMILEYIKVIIYPAALPWPPFKLCQSLPLSKRASAINLCMDSNFLWSAVASPQTALGTKQG